MAVPEEICLTSEHRNHFYTFRNYTTVWLESVYRGGHFVLSDKDKAYFLFRRLETIVTKSLPENIRFESASQDELVKKIVQDSELQKLLSPLSRTIEYTLAASSLLLEIVELWVRMRGFSVGCLRGQNNYEIEKTQIELKQQSSKKKISKTGANS